MRTINAEIKRMITFYVIRFLRIIVIITTNTISSHPDEKKKSQYTHIHTRSFFIGIDAIYNKIKVIVCTGLKVMCERKGV